MLLKLVPDQTNIPFTKWRMIAAAMSVLMVLGSIFAVYSMGLNFGVDFKGGVTIEVGDEEPIDIEAVKSSVNALNLGEARVQEIQDFAGGAERIIIFIEQQQVEDATAEDVAKQAEQAQQTSLRKCSSSTPNTARRECYISAD